MIHPLRGAFLAQAGHCDTLGSPFMARLCRLLADRLEPGMPLTDRLFAWPGNPGANGASVPLRLAGALHALRLGGHPGLAAVYPPLDVDDDTLFAAIALVLASEAAAIDRILDSPPQTNEVRRAAVLVGIGHWLADRFGLPLVLSEIGASAGLNLHWDRCSLAGSGWVRGPAGAAVALAPAWPGAPPPAVVPQIADRRGCDLNPLDPRRDRNRVLSYLWPDQAERLTMTRAALDLPPAPVDRADAAEWLARRAAPWPGHCHLICHTIVWQYFSPATAARARAAIETAGAAATDTAPLAWFGMEADGKGPGAGLTLRLWPGDMRLDFGRVDSHGRWVDWRPDDLPGSPDRIATPGIETSRTRPDGVSRNDPARQGG